MNVVNNPGDNQIIGLKGRANLLRMIMAQFPITVDEIIPTDDEIDSMQKLAEEQRQAIEEAELLASQGETPKAAKDLSISGERAAGGDAALFTDQNRGR